MKSQRSWHRLQRQVRRSVSKKCSVRSTQEKQVNCPGQQLPFYHLHDALITELSIQSILAVDDHVIHKKAPKAIHFEGQES